MPQSRVKTQKGGNFEVQVALPRSVLIDLLLARRRLREYIAEGCLYTASDYLRVEMTISVLSGLIARADEVLKNEGFTWNHESEDWPQA